MIPQWIIERKRDGHTLEADEIEDFIRGYTQGSVLDYQMAAFAMAVFFRGMSIDETTALTRAMWRSGDTIDTTGIPGAKIDKHSTGGVGDKISLILAPLAAVCGLTVPMIVGRGLGITGGTLDKLESIPGYRTDLDNDEFVAVLKGCRCSLVGQTSSIAPADRRLYALRDVTGTVPSVPLIVSSILGKKLAAGLDGLVMDVKWGSGAFMKSRDEARALASALIDVGGRLGLPVVALLTDMNRPLGRACGNALEVIEAVDVLKGGGPSDIKELTIALCAEMLVLGRLAANRGAGEKMATGKLESGEAFERFRQMVNLHGGDEHSLDDVDWLGHAGFRLPVPAPRRACVRNVDADAIGRACLLLGAGRTRTDGKVDPLAGVASIRQVGEWVEPGDAVAVMHASSRNALERALPLVEKAFEWSDRQERMPSVLTEILNGGEMK